MRILLSPYSSNCQEKCLPRRAEYRPGGVAKRKGRDRKRLPGRSKGGGAWLRTESGRDSVDWAGRARPLGPASRRRRARPAYPLPSEVAAAERGEGGESGSRRCGGGDNPSRGADERAAARRPGERSRACDPQSRRRRDGAVRRPPALGPPPARDYARPRPPSAPSRRRTMRPRSGGRPGAPGRRRRRLRRGPRGRRLPPPPPLPLLLGLLLAAAGPGAARAKETAFVEVVLFESSPSGDYTTHTTGLTGRFSRAGAMLSAEGEIVQVATRAPRSAATRWLRGLRPPTPPRASGRAGGGEARSPAASLPGGRDGASGARRLRRAHVGARPPVGAPRRGGGGDAELGMGAWAALLSWRDVFLPQVKVPGTTC